MGKFEAKTGKTQKLNLNLTLSVYFHYRNKSDFLKIEWEVLKFE